MPQIKTTIEVVTGFRGLTPYTETQDIVTEYETPEDRDNALERHLLDLEIAQLDPIERASAVRYGSTRESLARAGYWGACEIWMVVTEHGGTEWVSSAPDDGRFATVDYYQEDGSDFVSVDGVPHPCAAWRGRLLSAKVVNRAGQRI